MPIKQTVTDLFERPKGGERAVLVHIDFPNEYGEEDLQEFRDLVRSAGADTAALVRGTRKAPEPKYYVGSGKAEEIKSAVQASNAQIVLFNHALSPAQERNLEQFLQCRVCDRTGLILDIFAQRARTFEGKLQVELAQLQHLSTRLVRGWTHLERQRGGIGLRGPGETQLEVDRRLIRVRIKQIKKRLEKVRMSREQGRRARQRADIPTVSIVGYTNAGKSTLFNRLTQAQVYVENQLFATLDPTLRRIELPSVGPAVLADTVGFIRHLPHDLVEAFQATLEETRLADLLLHVVDVQSSERDDNLAQVDAVLAEVGAQNVPQLLIFNKIDLGEQFVPRIDRNAEGKPYRVWISALTGAGIELLRQAVGELLESEQVHCEMHLNASEGKLRAKLYAINAVQSERDDEKGGWYLLLRLERRVYDRFCQIQ